MRAAGIIAEFNPFHNGHAYLLEQARSITGCDAVVVIMSGNFVQDGTPAITDKYTRTYMCLTGSSPADMVFELPAVYATASAEGFAQAAVALLNSLGVVDWLCFGSEISNVERMMELAKFLENEPPAYQEQLRLFLSQGLSFPAARQKAVSLYFSSSDVTALLSQPNALLGIEYCRAILRNKSSMKPVAIPRYQTEHRSAALKMTFASATAIRSLLLEQTEEKHPLSYSDFLPTDAVPILKESLQKYPAVSPETLLPYFRQLQLQFNFSTVSGCYPKRKTASDPLLQTLSKLPLSSDTSHSYQDFIQQLKSKNYTQTRIQRTLLHLLLQIPETTTYPVYYLRLLGFRTNASQTLRQTIRQNARLPIITKVADYKEKLAQYPDELRTPALHQFETDLYVSHFYYLLQNSQQEYNEFTKGIIRLP